MFNSCAKKIAVLQTRLTVKSKNSVDKESKPAPKAIYITVSSVAAAMSVSQSASAQLNVGHYGVQTGLESEYLQYQISGHDLSQMESIPACDTGFGLTCNKTGAVLQQLVEKNNGLTYNDLLMRAAGGQENFHNFATFYGNNPNLAQVPYASFWQNDSSRIMDGYQYLLGQTLSRTPVDSLGSVTKSFHWAPLSASENALSLRSGLVDLKLSYGRLLLEEVSKIPDIKQQIQSLGLPQDLKNFYLSNLSKGLNALNTGDEKQLQDSIFHVLSHPFSPAGGEWGRPVIGITKDDNQLAGEGLPGDSFLASTPVLLEGDMVNNDIPFDIAGDVFVTEDSGNGLPGWLMGTPLALLLLLFLHGDSSSGHHLASIPPGTSFNNQTNDTSPGPVGHSQPGGGDFNGPGSGHSQPGGSDFNGPGSGHSQPGGSDFNGPGSTPDRDVKKVPEPSIAKSLVSLVILMCMLSYKQRYKQEVELSIQIGD